MIKKHIYSKDNTLLLLCLGMIWFGIFGPTFIFSQIIGGLGLIGFLTVGASMIGHTSLLTRLPWRKTWAAVTLGSTLMVGHAVVYWIYRIDQIVIATIFSLVGLGVAILRGVLGQVQHHQQAEGRTIIFQIWNRLNRTLRQPTWLGWIFALLVSTQMLIVGLIISTQTTSPLPSPWLAFDRKLFVLYAVSTFLLIFFQLKTRHNRWGLFTIIIHFVITYGVVGFVYPLGFGYDPLLHRASEQHILLHGLVSPKTPFYIGQYVLVTALAHITHLPIRVLDIWLVPSLAILLLPLATSYGLRYGLRVPERWARLGAILLTVVPLNTMFVTTPHNLANLFTLLTVLLSPVALRYHRSLVTIGALALSAVFTHPLSGIFALLFFLGSILFVYQPSFLRSPHIRIGTYGLYSLCVIIISPALFLLYFYLQGISPEQVIQASPHLGAFIDLFRQPYYFSSRPVPWLFDLIYGYRIAIPLLLIIGAIIGYKKVKTKKIRLYLLFPLLMLGTIFLVSTSIRLPDLDSYQQVQYAERLRHIVVYFVLPISLYGFIFLIRHVAKRSKSYTPVCIGLVSIALVTSWYLTYPQRNPKVYFRGFNVTASDYMAADVIAQNSPGTYIVLSNIMTAGAAIEQSGFPTYFDTNQGDIFYYAIPTGGPLYQWYLNMIHEGQATSTMLAAMDLTEVDRAYFLVHEYWDNADLIVEGAKKTANTWQVVGYSPQIWIFQYDRPTSTEPTS